MKTIAEPALLFSSCIFYFSSQTKMSASSLILIIFNSMCYCRFAWESVLFHKESVRPRKSSCAGTSRLGVSSSAGSPVVLWLSCLQLQTPQSMLRLAQAMGTAPEGDHMQQDDRWVRRGWCSARAPSLLANSLDHFNFSSLTKPTCFTVPDASRAWLFVMGETPERWWLVLLIVLFL